MMPKSRPPNPAEFRQQIAESHNMRSIVADRRRPLENHLSCRAAEMRHAVYVNLSEVKRWYQRRSVCRRDAFGAHETGFSRAEVDFRDQQAERRHSGIGRRLKCDADHCSEIGIDPA